MDWLVYLTKIAYQPAMTGFMYLVANQYTVDRERRWNASKGIRPIRRRNLSFGLILVLSILEGIYSVICGPKNVFLADREYYAFLFPRGLFTERNSIGIYYIQQLLIHYTKDPYVFFFVTGALFLLITLTAYSYSADATSLFFGLLCCSQYVMYGCYQIKQSIAIALSGLALVVLLRTKSLILPSILVGVSICFHEVAWIMLPILISVRYSDRLSIKIACYVTLFLAIMLFPVISRSAIALINRYMPNLSMQLTQYVDDSGEIMYGGGRLLSALKGFPFYYVTGFALSKRKELRSKVANFDAYIMMSVIISSTSILSVWSAWLWRFGELLYIPFFCFVCKLYDECDDRREATSFLAIVLGSLAVFTYRKLFTCYFTYGGII